MRFLDEAKIYLKGGNGGNGCVSFRREKFIPMGGPNGGDGGRGGSIILETNPNINTLINFRFKQHFVAKNGEHGKGSNRSGKSGQDLILQVPIGTQILDDTKKNIIFDFTQANQQYKIINGGKGGLGNSHFKSSTNQAPYIRTEGEVAAEMWVWLHLKLISDVGLVGLPNAGKSTFLSSVTAAKPKIADYPFTTLTPGLGVVYMNNKSFVLADIPGLIEGAHLGHGLGDKFLKHIERCKIIIHLIDINSENLVNNYHTIRQELESHSNLLMKKQEIICLSKIDSLDQREVQIRVEKLEKSINQKVYPLSSHSKKGVNEVLYYTLDKIKEYNQSNL